MESLDVNSINLIIDMLSIEDLSNLIKVYPNLKDFIIDMLSIEDLSNLIKVYPNLKDFIIKRKEKDLIERVAPSKQGMVILDRTGQINLFNLTLDDVPEQKFDKIFGTVSGDHIIGVSKYYPIYQLIIKDKWFLSVLEDEIRRFNFRQEYFYSKPEEKLVKIFSNADNFCFMQGLGSCFYVATNRQDLYGQGVEIDTKNIIRVNMVRYKEKYRKYGKMKFLILDGNNNLIKNNSHKILIKDVFDFVHFKNLIVCLLKNRNIFVLNIKCQVVSFDDPVVVSDVPEVGSFSVPEVVQGQTKYITTDGKTILFTLLDHTVWNLEGEKLKENVIYGIARSDYGHIYIMADGYVCSNQISFNLF